MKKLSAGGAGGSSRGQGPVITVGQLFRSWPVFPSATALYLHKAEAEAESPAEAVVAEAPVPEEEKSPPYAFFQLELAESRANKLHRPGRN